MTVKYPESQTYNLESEINLQRELDLQKELDTFQDFFNYIFGVEPTPLTIKFKNVNINFKRKIKKEITFERVGEI